MPNNKSNRRSNIHVTQKRKRNKYTKRKRNRKYNHNNVRSIQRKKTRHNKRHSTARGMWLVDKLNKKQIQQNANRAAEKIRDARAHSHARTRTHAHAPAPPEGENAPVPPKGEKIQEPLKDYSIFQSEPNGFFALKKGFIGKFKKRYFIFLPSNYGPHRSTHLYWYKNNNPVTKEGVGYKGEMQNFTTEIDLNEPNKLIIKGSNYNNSSRLKRTLEFNDQEDAEHIYKILTQTVTPKDLAKYTNLQDNKRKMEEHAKQMKKKELQHRLSKSIYSQSSQTIHPQNKSSSSLNTSSSSMIRTSNRGRSARTLRNIKKTSTRKR